MFGSTTYANDSRKQRIYMTGETLRISSWIYQTNPKYTCKSEMKIIQTIAWTVTEWVADCTSVELRFDSLRC